jgi:hypothetical protein
METTLAVATGARRLVLHLGDGVQRALGRPPRDFADFARDAATAGVWRGR